MKKSFLSLTIAVVVTLLSNVCAAYEYKYDPHYVFVTTSQGAIYLDLRTVNVHDYNPPHYQIAGFFVWENGKNEERFEVVIKYNWDKKETYHRNNGYWTKDDVKGDVNLPRNNRKMADALFRAAYGMDFYGY